MLHQHLDGHMLSQGSLKISFTQKILNRFNFRYTAAGNFLGQFAENVLPLGTEQNDSEPDDHGTENDTDEGTDSGTDEGVEVSDHQEAGLVKVSSNCLLSEESQHYFSITNCEPSMVLHR